MDLVICLVIATLIAAAICGVARAILSLPFLADFAPYGNVFYALIVLLCVLFIVNYCLGVPSAPHSGRHFNF